MGIIVAIGFICIISYLRAIHISLQKVLKKMEERNRS
ncbi:hypothetical protein SAMN05880570_3486 [Paenibacillus sp. RU4T]|nr:hypothetical protein SAMN05880555_3485 [Paenibacillus sp. RU4X]SIR43898.1 hypothetical protein SAMN05880570_3486 [Paenibacillus sp. RU4T]